MKRLIVCNDGTWNNPSQEENGIPAPTNVYKLYNALAERDSAGIEQRKYYHPGVGGEGGLADSILGGTVGAGISGHICSAYHWLGLNYVPGDDIYFIGFSRGAFTARSVAAFIGKGLLDLRNLSSKESWERVHRAYEKGYRKKDSQRSQWAEADWAFFDNGNTKVRFVGVWDTVGALGVPDDLEIFNIFEDKKKWEFFDTRLGNHVTTARHAMAIDEVRSSFSVTRWENARLHGDAVELWFPGVHSDVGGGYAHCDLSNGALLWMMEEAEKTGLVFRKDIKPTIKADSLGVMHNSYKGVFARFRSRPRNVDALVPANHHLFHYSAIARQKISPIEHRPYQHTRILNVDESHTVDVFANTHWNYTGIYMEKGQQFTFSASGEWQDSKDTCDWTGTEDNKLTTGDIMRGIGSFFGHFDSLYKKLVKNGSTDFAGTKRVEEFKWFTLAGAITNDSGVSNAVKNDGSPTSHQYVSLPDYQHTTLAIDHPGYLYCFANDVWSLYDNNRGSIKLTIKRIL